MTRHAAGIAEESALFVAVVIEVADAIVAGKTGLGHHEIDDAVEFLAGVEVVVGRKTAVTFVHEQLMDGQVEAGAVLGEAVGAVGVFAAPFVEGGEFDAAAGGGIAAEQVVDEDEFELGGAVFEGLFEPLVLGRARDQAQPSAPPRWRSEKLKGSSTTKRASPHCQA